MTIQVNNNEQQSLSFAELTLWGEDIKKFLQGQITADIEKIGSCYQITAICNLKGRVDFGFWIKAVTSDSEEADKTQYSLVMANDCVADFTAHIKKYGAFSKIALSDAVNIQPVIVKDGEQTKVTFFHNKVKSKVESNSDKSRGENIADWLLASIAQAQVVISQELRGLFQPQELRLHQLGGVHYDKGCYLGQEVVARIWFKASPKAWLHRVAGVGDVPKPATELAPYIQVVNAVKTASGYEALVVARVDALEASELTILSLPKSLPYGVAREQA